MDDSLQCDRFCPYTEIFYAKKSQSPLKVYVMKPRVVTWVLSQMIVEIVPMWQSESSRVENMKNMKGWDEDMKCRIDAVENVFRRISDERTKRVVTVAMENHPKSVYDFDKLIRTHSCKPEKQADLLERVVAIVASYLSGVDRKYLRDVAFSTVPIDWSFGKKRFDCVTISEVEVKDVGRMIYWVDKYGAQCGTLLGSVDDKYEPQVGDEAFFYIVRGSVTLAKVVNGHVFSYRTIEQDMKEMREAREELMGLIS